MNLKEWFQKRKLTKLFETFTARLEASGYPTWFTIQPMEFCAQREAPCGALCAEFPTLGKRCWLYIGKADTAAEFSTVLEAYRDELQSLTTAGARVHTYSPRWFN